ncbi:hypothetical protein SAMN05421741_11329 [Paenimyroides ummariense]|uniref:Uncharacterized protein n=1 Tax=Paenimyroides ummariense TaxID=913024 RepID=A0A1I5CS79_9FLAO|nr:hypothetical protein [Paenimyroides ummariense]SFN89511.1 hypothetical protein SAMN05421741_11329 [Paenimyroides ummariense]
MSKDECGSLIRTLDEKLFKISEEQTLETFIERLAFIEENKDLKSHEFTIFITWAGFAAKNSNKESFGNYSYIKQNYGSNIKVFLLNLDINESWNWTKEQKELLKL